MNETIIKLIRKIKGDWESKINEHTDLYNDLMFDELDSIELLMDSEVKFKISISDLEWDKCNNVKDVIALIDKTINSSK